MKPDSQVPEDDDVKTSPQAPADLPPALSPPSLSPVEKLQRRYSDQLSHEIGQLEAQKAQLQTEISSLTNVYTVLEADIQALRASVNEARQAAGVSGNTGAGPRLPGEHVAIARPFPQPTDVSQSTDVIELPLPATSEQRRQRRMRQRITREASIPSLRKGWILSAIALLLIAIQFCLISTLSQGGSWLGLTINQLGVGFLPAAALLWLRMLVTVPTLALIAPLLYPNTWEDLQYWIYRRDRLLTLLIGSGIALFFSQVLAYQCIGLLGPAVGVTLLFLYPLTAVPLELLLGKNRRVASLGWLALVAIAMGGALFLKPLLALESVQPSTLWLGLLASLCFGLYISLTNLSYRQQQCHPIPVGLVQFSTVAVLSSVVLLAKPIEPIFISWLSFALWGLLIGFFMLLVYLLNYASLRLIGARTAIVAAAVPVVTSLLSWSFTPKPSLAIVQWTGIALVTIGGVALAQDSMTNAAKVPKDKERTS